MKKLIQHVIIALFTFAVGVAFSSLAEQYLGHTTSILSFSDPVEIESIEGGVRCQVHGSIMQPKRVQALCGIYEGKYGRTEIYCDDSKPRQLAPEDALFVFNLIGGENTLQFWREYRAAKDTQFPHGYSQEYQECESNVERCKIIKVCPKCRAAEIMWKSDALKDSGYLVR